MVPVKQNHKAGGAVFIEKNQVEFTLWAPAAPAVYLQLRDINQSPPIEDHSALEIDKIIADFILETDYNYKIRHNNQLNPFPYKPEALKENKWSYLFGNHKNLIAMKSCGNGFFRTVVKDITNTFVYRFLLKSFNQLTPVKDPVSRLQPFGSDGWSAIVDHTQFQWTDKDWIEGKTATKLLKTGYSKPKTMIAAEFHPGTFTTKGTFESALQELDVITKEGIYNTVEVMPIAEFSGKFNWGYDGVDWYAPHHKYCTGTNGQCSVDLLKSFVNKAHKLGLNVILDVVYNHLGSFFNVYDKFGPYLGPGTAWGPAPNFFNQQAKDLIIHNALYWLLEYHFDGLRLDASFCIPDPLLKEIVFEVRKQKPEAFLIAEDWRNTKRVVRKLAPELLHQANLNSFELQKEVETKGYLKALGYDAQWNPDFAHVLIALITGKPMGMYTVFGYHVYEPNLKDIATMLTQGFIKFNNEESEPDPPPAHTFVNYALSHDEAGNFDGSRILVKILQNTLKLEDFIDKTGLLSSLVEQKESPDYEKKLQRRIEQLTASITFKLLETYCKLNNQNPFNEELWEKIQETFSLKQAISKENFEQALRISIDLNKLALATLFVMPGHKMLFYGDEKGELAPFKFFADYPVENLATKISRPEDKGYNVGLEAYEQSKIGSWLHFNIAQQISLETSEFMKKLATVFSSHQALLESEFLTNTDIKYNEDNKYIELSFKDNSGQLLVLINYSHKDLQQTITHNITQWKVILDSSLKNNLEKEQINLQKNPVVQLKARSVLILNVSS